MYYLGIDCHKRFSYVTALDEAGQVKFKGKLGNKKEDFKGLLTHLGGNCKATLETGYDWGILFDILKELGLEVILAHAKKIKLITGNPLKTDKRDSLALAQLLKAGLIPVVYAPTQEVRRQKAVLRERQFYVKIRTMAKNKIHKLLYRNGITMDGYSDAFGKSGRQYMEKAILPDTEKTILDNELEMLDVLSGKIKIMEKTARNVTKENKYVELLKTLPGLGEVMSRTIALEIIDINRFSKAKKLASYCGLVPKEHSSSDHIYRGSLIKDCNTHLKEAFVEASWVAIRSSAYFRRIYENVKSRRGGNKAIVAVARQMAEIVFYMLKENRPYLERYSTDIKMAAL
jgi:transposase